VSVEVQGSTALVSCLVSITSAIGEKMQRAQAYATNVFVFEDDRWLLVLHHASILQNSQETV